MHRRESLTQTFPCFSPNRLRPPPQFLPRGSFFGVWYFTHSSMLFQDFTRAGYHIATIAYVASTIVVAIFVQDLSIPAEFSGIIIVVICIFFPGVLKMKCADTAMDRFIGIALMVFAVGCTGVCLFCAIHNVVSRS
eukprot:m.79843 g.79843  ORF g.79843 m.79843 type:complete len:136 (+) comp16291_c0_seq6:2202-2609(+)